MFGLVGSKGSAPYRAPPRNKAIRPLSLGPATHLSRGGLLQFREVNFGAFFLFGNNPRPDIEAGAIQTTAPEPSYGIVVGARARTKVAPMRAKLRAPRPRHLTYAPAAMMPPPYRARNQLGGS